MFTSDHPCAACHCDSARVENRGPSITTMVPPSTSRSPCSAAGAEQVATQPRAVRVGEADVAGARVVVGLHPAGGPVDQLVGNHERAGAELGPQAPHGTRRQHLAHAERAQRPQVGPIVDPMGGMSVLAAVPRQERDRPGTIDRRQCRLRPPAQTATRTASRRRPRSRRTRTCRTLTHRSRRHQGVPKEGHRCRQSRTASPTRARREGSTPPLQ